MKKIVLESPGRLAVQEAEKAGVEDATHGVDLVHNVLCGLVDGFLNSFGGLPLGLRS